MSAISALPSADLFYRAFEERNRGSRELIKSRLLAYLPFLEPMKAQEKFLDAIDLGCGRGEWLEVLRDAGLRARGVDLDHGMLAACAELQLDVQQGNALEVLQTLPAQSVNIVSAFHVIEHIAFDDVRLLIRESLRVLRPGGLLILETPNPENIVVGTSLFYLDPSHERPIPCELLSFAVEYEGFSRHTIVRLQEPASLQTALKLDLIQVLNAVSPDYAVVAQKADKPEVLALFDEVFERSYGVNLHALANRYQLEQDGRHDQLATQSNAWITYCENRFTQGDERYAHASTRLLQLEGRLEREALLMQLGAILEREALLMQLGAILERIEALLIQLGAIKALLRRLIVKMKKSPKWFVRKVFALIRRFPLLHQLCLKISQKSGLHSFLLRLSYPNTSHAGEGQFAQAPSERVEHIYAQLKKAQKGHWEQI